MDTIEISARRADLSDELDVYAWRNDPLTRRFSKTNDEVTLTAHRTWYRKVLDEGGVVCLICEAAHGKLGVVRFDDCAPDGWRANINLNPAFRGFGYAAPILQAGVDYMRGLGNGAFVCVAEIHRENLPSRRIFERCGFGLSSDAGDFLTYTLADAG